MISALSLCQKHLLADFKRSERVRVWRSERGRSCLRRGEKKSTRVWEKHQEIEPRDREKRHAERLKERLREGEEGSREFFPHSVLCFNPCHDWDKIQTPSCSRSTQRTGAFLSHMNEPFRIWTVPHVLAQFLFSQSVRMCSHILPIITAADRTSGKHPDLPRSGTDGFQVPLHKTVESQEGSWDLFSVSGAKTWETGHISYQCPCFRVITVISTSFKITIILGLNCIYFVHQTN